MGLLCHSRMIQIAQYVTIMNNRRDTLKLLGSLPLLPISLGATDVIELPFPQWDLLYGDIVNTIGNFMINYRIAPENSELEVLKGEFPFIELYCNHNKNCIISQSNFERGAATIKEYWQIVNYLESNHKQAEQYISSKFLYNPIQSHIYPDGDFKLKNDELVIEDVKLNFVGFVLKDFVPSRDATPFASCYPEC